MPRIGIESISKCWINGRPPIERFALNDAEALIASVEEVFGLLRDKFCGPGKTAQAVMAKEVLMLTGRETGATITDLSSITDLDTSNVSRRCDAAKQKIETDSKLAYAKDLVAEKYRAESQA